MSNIIEDARQRLFNRDTPIGESGKELGLISENTRFTNEAFKILFQDTLIIPALESLRPWPDISPAAHRFFNYYSGTNLDLRGISSIYCNLGGSLSPMSARYLFMYPGHLKDIGGNVELTAVSFRMSWRTSEIPKENLIKGEKDNGKQFPLSVAYFDIGYVKSGDLIITSTLGSRVFTSGEWKGNDVELGNSLESSYQNPVRENVFYKAHCYWDRVYHTPGVANVGAGHYGDVLIKNMVPQFDQMKMFGVQSLELNERGFS